MAEMSAFGAYLQVTNSTRSRGLLGLSLPTGSRNSAQSLLDSVRIVSIAVGDKLDDLVLQSPGDQIHDVVVKLAELSLSLSLSKQSLLLIEIQRC